VSYRVIFKPQVDRDLVDLWLESDHQRAMTEAIDRLVRQLVRDPLQVGESRGPQRRIALEWPVGIEFEIDDVAREVRIYRLWTFRARNDADG
jgi:hypothetical protein